MNEIIQIEDAHTVLTNATELAVGIVLNILGNDVASSIGGTSVGKSAITQLVTARLQQSLN
jgi:uncharacterized membrane protein YcjF (UPF0283 family)